MTPRLRVAVVGLNVGLAHLRAYLALPERYEVMAVCDLDPARGQGVAREHGVPRAVTSLDAVCAMEDVELVDLCTPPFLHREQIEQVLRSGRDVICEKPLVGSLRHLDELLALEHETGRRVMPIFQYRYGHGVQKLRALVGHGLCGPALLATAETHWRRRADYYGVPWRGKWATELGGTLVSHALHAHDVLTYVLGPVRRVHARLATRVNPIEVEDVAVGTLEMQSGAFVTLSATTGSSAEISRHRFCFRHLTAESSTAPYRHTSDPWVFTADDPETEARMQAVLRDLSLGPEGFEGQFLAFHEAVGSGGPPPVTLADARTSLELLTALYASAHSGQDVSLPLSNHHPLSSGWQPAVTA